MLDQNALGQLKGLKKQIRDTTPRVTGLVKGTKKRFGFVTCEQTKQDYLLPQTEMERVLPGDKVGCVLVASEKPDEKPIAKIEKLISSDFSHFIGTVKEKKQQFYIVADHQELTRWIFIPPKFRKNISDGDLVSGVITQHPFHNKGRVQAKVDFLIGKPSDPYIEHRFALAKHQIPEKIWQTEEIEAVRMTGEQVIHERQSERDDLRDLPFVTIDGSNTQDLDDALYIQALDNGWRLSVAIADVSEFVDINSPLDKIAKAQMSSIYMPGQKVSMLPDILSSNLCSLKAGADRLALICHLSLNNDGEITDTQYQSATINNHGKLSYDDVAKVLDGDDTLFDAPIRSQLQMLGKAAKALNTWRKNHALMGDDYADYRLHLNDKGKITAIDRSQRNAAQHLVEECMLACNRATANFLKSHSKQALFVSNNGFKDAQMPGIEKLLQQYFPEQDAKALNDIQQFRAFIQQLPENAPLPFLDILRKKLKPSEWLDQSYGHFGLGFDNYTTFTSPIRKYSDLIVHRMIKRILAGKAVKPLPENLLSELNRLNKDVRSVQRDCELNLKCQYLQGFIGKTFIGEISLINHRMIGVYLPDFDVHGQVEVRSLKQAFTFKQESLELSTDTQHFMLKQKVNVSIANVDQTQRVIKLHLVLDEPEQKQDA